MSIRGGDEGWSFFYYHKNTAAVWCVPVLCLRLFRRMAYIGPRLRELQIIPYIGHTYA